MSLCKKKFWIQNPPDLFCSIGVIPLTSMSIEEQMNAFTRFVIVIFFLMLFFMLNSTTSFIFLFVSLLFIIILYYIQKRTMDNYQKENYQNPISNDWTSDTRSAKSHQHKIRKRSVNCGYCGNNGKCRKGCKIDTKVLDTDVLINKENGSPILGVQNSALRFCNDERLLSPNDPNFVSLNQRLAGPPNPKTLLKPVITPPLADLDFWKANNLINHSHINTQSQWDTYLSGYEVSNCCDPINECMVPIDKPIKEHLGTIMEEFEHPTYIGISDPKRPASGQCNPLPRGNNPILSPTPVTMTPLCNERYSAVRERDVTEGYQGPVLGYKEGSPVGTYTRDQLRPIHLQHVTQIKTPQPASAVPATPVMENFEYPYLKDQPAQRSEHSSVTNGIVVRDNESGWVNTMCGYNPNQVAKSNLPSNLASSNCERDEAMKEYNKNLFTQNIQPDIYTYSEIIEPINSNIGISFTQQSGPTTCSRKDGKGLTYTEHDPRIFQPEKEPHDFDMRVTEADVYDPRFSGYGTSYRAYTDKNIGQTRFYYDDVNAIRMPNYLVRSNIDFAKYADSYGPLDDNNKHGNQYNSNIRALAQDSFLQSSLQNRTELQERLMRKRNNEMWQLRKYPMRTF
jgi:hypothetical protein